MWNLTIENDATNFISYGDWIENSLDIFSIVDNYRRSFWCSQNIFEKWKNNTVEKKIIAKIIQLKKFKPENVGNSDNTYWI